MAAAEAWVAAATSAVLVEAVSTVVVVLVQGAVKLLQSVVQPALKRPFDPPASHCSVPSIVPFPHEFASWTCA